MSIEAVAKLHAPAWACFLSPSSQSKFPLGLNAKKMNKLGKLH